MILWGRSSSVNVQKVLWTLDELGLDFEHRIVGGKYGGTDTPDFGALNPARRVPVLEDGAQVVWESHAIMRYLARRAGRLGASDVVAEMWMEYGATTLQPPFIRLFWEQVRTPPARRDPAVAAEHGAALTHALEILALGLADGRCHLAGSDFSMADIAVGSLFYRINDLLPDAVARLPHLSEWRARIARRKGYMDRIATSYDELKVTA